MSAGYWVVAQTKPHQERWAAENVSRQGFSWYLPMTRQKLDPRRPAKTVCLFPRYLFVWTDGAWRSLLGTFGVTSLVMSGERPSALPERAIESLKSRQGSDGLIRLPDALPERLKPGTPVRVNGGVFSGYTGVTAQDTGAARVKVLLDLLGRKTTVLIGNEDLELT